MGRFGRSAAEVLNTALRRRWLVLLIVVAASAMWLVWECSRYRTFHTDCSAPAQLSLTPPLGAYPDDIEFYMHGWIHAGSVVVENGPGSLWEPTTIQQTYPGFSFAERGDWYSDTPMTFTPSADASCSIKVVYWVASIETRLIGFLHP